MAPGAQSALIFGLILMQKWPAGQQVILATYDIIGSFYENFIAECLAMMMLHVQLPPTSLGQLLLLPHSGWTMCSAQDRRKLWTSVAFQGGAFTIVTSTQLMLELYVPTVIIIMKLAYS